MTECLSIPCWQQAYLLKALNKGGNAKEAAKLLGVSERTVGRWMEEFSIDRKVVFVIDKK